MVLDRLADKAGWTGHARARDAAATVHGRYAGLDLMLAKPTTYMNLSGVAVRKILARQRAPLEDMLVVVDDFDLPLGKLRLRAEGSAGTHNGLKSIIAELGSQKFARLRVGIGEPGRDARDHVLSQFAASEKALLGQVLDAAAEAVEDWAREGVNRAANKWNSWAPTTTPKTEEPLVTEEDRPIPDAEGIVRRRTGWRRLLPVRDD
jgi:PTH1 family peptidyl-tRNA hydrolase